MFEQIAQRGVRAYTLVCVENLTGHGPESPTPADPALSRRVGLYDLQRSLPTLSMPSYYDSVNGKGGNTLLNYVDMFLLIFFQQ